jgi:hypothetical protein
LVELYVKCMARKGVDLVVQAPISVWDGVSVPQRESESETVVGKAIKDSWDY